MQRGEVFPKASREKELNVVPGGFLPPSGPVVNPAPFGVTFTGRAFSEPRLIALAYAFEQATKHRQAPASAPPLSMDFVSRP